MAISVFPQRSSTPWRRRLIRRHRRRRPGRDCGWPGRGTRYRNLCGSLGYGGNRSDWCRSYWWLRGRLFKVGAAERATVTFLSPSKQKPHVTGHPFLTLSDSQYLLILISFLLSHPQPASLSSNLPS